MQETTSLVHVVYARDILFVGPSKLATCYFSCVFYALVHKVCTVTVRVRVLHGQEAILKSGLLNRHRVQHVHCNVTSLFNAQYI